MPLSLWAAAEAAAQGGIGCQSLTRGPDYSFEKVIDVDEAFPLGLIPNDRGHALIHADPDAGTSGTCLLRHRGATTEPVEAKPEDPYVIEIGGSRIEIGTLAVTLLLSKPLVELKVVAKKSALVLASEDGDGFVAKLLPASGVGSTSISASGS